jgi:HPt (histidine-containing phosphotransfer) domain-containing protein
VDDDLNDKLETLDTTIIQEIQSLQKPDEPMFLVELITIFLKDSHTRIIETHQALERKDFAEARDKVHSLKGLSGGLGARKLVSYCSELETALNYGRCDEIQSGFGKIMAEHLLVCNAIKRMVDI